MRNNHPGPILLLLVLVLSIVQQQSRGRELKSEMPRPAPRVAQAIMPGNKCPYLGVKNGAQSMSIWTCTIPKEIKYCGTPSQFVYDCCPGFQKTPQISGDVCGEVLSVWRTVSDFLYTYNYPETAKVLATTAVNNTVNEKVGELPVYTFFASIEDSEFKNMQNKNLVLHSIVRDRINSMSLKDGDELTTLADNHKLKVAIYSNNIITVECQILLKPDMETKNGIVHFLSKTIPVHSGPVGQHSILKQLQDNPETSAFAADLPADLKKQLDDVTARQWYTVLAPNKAAWSQVKSKYGASAGAVASNHVVPRMFCSQAISEASSRIASAAGPEQFVGLDCDSSGERFAVDACGERVPITTPDLMADNGVIHIVSKPLIPTQVMEALDAVQCGAASAGYDVSKTISDIKACNIKINPNTLVLAPVNFGHDWFASYKPFSNEYQRFRTDSTYRCNVYKYQLLKLEGELKSLPASWWNQVQFSTNYAKSGAFSDSYYVKYRNGSKLYFENSRVLNMNAVPFKGGYIYYTDRVNPIPEKTRFELLKERKDMSAITAKFEATGYNKNLLSSGSRSLYLAPRDKGWKKRAENLYSGKMLDNYLRLHHVKLRYWGDDIGHFERETYQTVETHLMIPGDKENIPFELKFKRAANGNMYIGYESMPESDWAMVLEWNLYGTDGIVWVIDWPLLCPPGFCKALVLPDRDYQVVYATTCIDNEGIANQDRFYKDPVALARKHLDKCVVLKLPPKMSLRKWEVDLG